MGSKLIVVTNKEIKHAWCIQVAKLQEDWYGGKILKFKSPKTVELTYLQANKQEAKYRS